MAETIKLFLMDDTPTGSIKCTIDGRIEVVYKIPRTEIENFKNRPDLKSSGVYFLFGISDKTGSSVVYVGQAGNRGTGDGILERLLEHKKNPDKDYWSEAVVFTTANNSFGPTEISFLENKFYTLAKAANRYEVKNGNTPSLGNVTEETESALNKSIHYVRIIMGTLGHNVFEPLVEIPHGETADELPKFYLSRKLKSLGATLKAAGKQTAEGFVVLKGSQISPKEDSTIPAIVKNARSNAKISADNILLEDVLLPSPSGAAMMVIGKSANGLTEWKTKTGVTLKDFETNS